MKRAAEARRLRDQGLLLREIAERMGVAKQTVDAWLHDPDGSRLRARKASYRGVCEECGGPTNGSNGPGRAPTVCRSCREWPPERIVLAIQAWAEEHGGIPPTVLEWSGGAVDHPADTTVVRRFAGWNNALLAAGFALRCDRRPETQEWIIREIRAGRLVVEIASALGVSPNAVYRRLAYRGLSVAEIRAA